eukprot:TRINITY_DN649_c0_g1_i1.p2 TRINITY_DN649_c0_g1~~TRINITY_DN649_c0_g1_i1.p2  ORF type:complete len:322 (-),score=107.09 TRINITY_DN649_c0_g1_i1:90-1022(-)
MADAGSSDRRGRRGGRRGGRGRRGEGGAPRRGGAQSASARAGGKGDEEKWVPVTKLGRLVKDGKIKQLEEIFLHSLPVKEYQIIDNFLGSKLKDEVMKIMPVQKQTTAGQRTRFKSFVVVGDHDGHVGLGVKCAKETATSIRGAIISAKLALVPVRRGYWGNKIGKVHTVPMKVTGKSGSVKVRLIPAPRGTGLVAALAPKRILEMAGIEDVFTGSTGNTKSMGNFIKATFAALSATYGFLTPDLWDEYALVKSPFQEFSDHLSNYDSAAADYGKRLRRQKDNEVVEPVAEGRNVRAEKQQREKDAGKWY